MYREKFSCALIIVFGYVLWCEGHQAYRPKLFFEEALEVKRFIRQSMMEFSIAKHGYLVCKSGWFSQLKTYDPISGHTALA